MIVEDVRLSERCPLADCIRLLEVECPIKPVLCVINLGSQVLQRVCVNLALLNWNSIDRREVCDRVIGCGLYTAELNALERHATCDVEADVGVHDIEDGPEWLSFVCSRAECRKCTCTIVGDRICAIKDAICCRILDLSASTTHIDKVDVYVVSLCVSLGQSCTQLCAPINGVFMKLACFWLHKLAVAVEEVVVTRCHVYSHIYSVVSASVIR